MAEFMDSIFYGLDTAVFAFFGNLQTEALNYIADFLSLFGTVEAFIVYIVLAVIMMTFRQTRKFGIALAFALIIGSAITNIILKPTVARLRPYMGLRDTEFWTVFEEFYIFAGSNIESDYSFPSGHTTVAFEVAVSMSLVGHSCKKRWLYILIPIAALIGMSRIYLMVHYTTDVVTGLIVGTGAGIVAFFLAELIYKYQELRCISRAEIAQAEENSTALE